MLHVFPFSYPCSLHPPRLPLKPKEKLELLRDPQVMRDEYKMKTATTLSHTIYRILDAKSSDTAKGQKAQLQNIFHSCNSNIEKFRLNCITKVTIIVKDIKLKQF